jgi:hypothetical protein
MGRFIQARVSESVRKFESQLVEKYTRPFDEFTSVPQKSFAAVFFDKLLSKIKFDHRGYKFIYFLNYLSV